MKEEMQFLQPQKCNDDVRFFNPVTVVSSVFLSTDWTETNPRLNLKTPRQSEDGRIVSMATMY